MTQGTTKSNWQVAFHPITGDHLDYDGELLLNPEWKWGAGNHGVERLLSPVYKPADYTFRAVLQHEGYQKGRSRVSIYFRDVETGLRYTMQLAEFMRCVPTLRRGYLHGEFGFAKNGTSTGLVRLGD